MRRALLMLLTGCSLSKAPAAGPALTFDAGTQDDTASDASAADAAEAAGDGESDAAADAALDAGPDAAELEDAAADATADATADAAADASDGDPPRPLEARFCSAEIDGIFLSYNGTRYSDGSGLATCSVKISMVRRWISVTLQPGDDADALRCRVTDVYGLEWTFETADATTATPEDSDPIELECQVL